MKLRKLNRVLHRDLGYLFTGMIIIYAISGIALNHIKDFNPNYTITREQRTISIPQKLAADDKAGAISILAQFNEADNYRKHYFPSRDELKIFLKQGGSIVVNLKNGETLYESLKKRPLLHQVNFLHYNPGHLWKWFSDVFAVVLIVLAITGLFILKGKNGITRRGAWLTAIGIIVPLIFLLMYY